jgi:hypothetical protein
MTDIPDAQSLSVVGGAIRSQVAAAAGRVLDGDSALTRMG